MHKVLILGAGKIGALISGLLAESGDYRVHVADVNPAAARSVVDAHGLPNLEAHAFDARDPDALAAHLRQHPVDAIISSLPFYCNVKVAEIAKQVGAHYFDLTEDVSVTRAADRIEYAETAAQYEYMDLVNHSQGEGLTLDELRAVVKAFNVQTTLV